MNSQIKLFDSNEISCIIGDEGCLGKGSYGTVRCGFHSQYGILAIKCSEVLKGVGKRNIVEKGIKSEIDFLQTANHENVVCIYGWTHWIGAIAIIMEYLPGGNLMELLEDHEVEVKPLLRLRICYEVSNAISFIHNLKPDKRLVHGDLKPANILLTKNLHCKIGDFGSARLSVATGMSTMTSNHWRSIHFTELFAAPELIDHPAGKLKPWHDTYSFAITIFVLLARQLPVISDQLMNIYLEKLKHGIRPELEVINDVIDGFEQEGNNGDAKIMTDMVEIMKECWEQNPHDRPLMLVVKNKLQIFLSEHDPVTIEEYAAATASAMDMVEPEFENHDCVPLNRFLAPDFRLVISESHLAPRNTKSFRHSFTSLSRASTFSIINEEPESCFHQMLRTTVSSVKQQLQNDKLEESVAGIEKLVNIPTADVAGDSYVIISDLIDISSMLSSKENFVLAISTLKVALNLTCNIENVKSQLSKMNNCIYVIGNIAIAMKKRGNLHDIERLCISLLHRLLIGVDALETEEVRIKVEVKTWCLFHIGRCYSLINEMQLAMDTCKEGIDLMTKNFGKDAKKHWVFASCHHNCAEANYEMKRYKAAIKLYNLCIRLYNCATDLGNDYKSRVIAFAEDHLTEVRFRLWGTSALKVATT